MKFPSERIRLRRHLGGESPTFGLPQGCSFATDRNGAGSDGGEQCSRRIPVRAVLFWFLGIPVPIIILLYVSNVI
ncbi:hypothetical protein EJV46_21490 [Roseococcus sp. SYP-B2431]|uniref:hypothetical protein n=1 Tax=Roseococcus sp. SYP-B2431 TaxID=2496640 RepID=UPI0010402A02|nr:hypothetical protein [Roseococcus sp. SYP-B2431]TCH96157.1 hypothetical protein EJV46_21490 [Roseococcus sp. SYP-B2431]